MNATTFNIKRENYKNSFMERHKLDNDFFEVEKNVQMINLMYKYSSRTKLLRATQITGFMQHYKAEIIFLYKHCTLENVLLLFNFGKDFNDKIKGREERKEKIQQDKLAALKLEEEAREKKLQDDRAQCTQTLIELFASDIINCKILEDFFNKNERTLRSSFNCPFTFRGIMSHFKVPKELRQRILDEQAVIKQQIKEKKEKERVEELRKRRERLAYLATLGLSHEIMITKSTLTNIFTDKIITEHFPVPFSEAQNPNLSRSYQKSYGLSMKLYRMADVMEAIKSGVPYRFKSELKPEYASMIEAFMIDSSLGETAKSSNGVLKV